MPLIEQMERLRSENSSEENNCDGAEEILASLIEQTKGSESSSEENKCDALEEIFPVPEEFSDLEN